MDIVGNKPSYRERLDMLFEYHSAGPLPTGTRAAGAGAAGKACGGYPSAYAIGSRVPGPANHQ